MLKDVHYGNIPNMVILYVTRVGQITTGTVIFSTSGFQHQVGHGSVETLKGHVMHLSEFLPPSFAA